MKSAYLTKDQKIRSSRKPLSILVILSFVFAIAFGSLTAFASLQKNSQRAEAFDVTKWTMCYFGRDSIPGMIYQNSQSSDMQFALRSKSSITNGVDNVESGFNWILNIFGPGYREVNESIVGYKLDPFDGLSSEEGAEKEKKEDNFNKGKKVNPFDRFGVAGLKFSSYSGEWKHVVIDACSTESSEPQDPKAGVFYEERLEPRSTWDDIKRSEDIRTMQFSKGLGSQFDSALSNIFANAIFTVTKGIVVVTVGLINFSFTDIVDLMGIKEIIAGDGKSNTGLFGVLFSGIFMPLYIFAFVITGGYIFWVGAKEQQYREALGAFLRSVLMFMIAIIISVKPAMFITIPNKVAVITQSIIITAMNSGLSGGNGLCSTDIGSFKTKIVTNEKAKPEGILTQASENMRSAVGCQLWQNFLVKPWSQGQWGSDWNKLWAKDKTPDWAKNSDSKELNNKNSSMVGDAAVPMGDGTFINNWAIFNISTQTNVHSPISHEGERSKYTSGVANDWWRIVDALSNYEEEDKTFIASGEGPYGGANEVKYTGVKNNPVLNNWDTWVGNNASSRIWTATSSTIIALIGVAAPLIFAFLTTVYSIGVSILMAFAPIMLLMGCWAEKGWELFKSWGDLVINTTIKRIVVGGLLALSIGLTAAILKFMETSSWWEGILMMIVVSVVIVKSRNKIIDALSSVNTGSFNLSSTASKLNADSVAGMKTAGRITGNALVAGTNSKRYGGSFRKGASAGFMNEIKNMSYSRQELRNALTGYEGVKTSIDNEILKGQEICSSCGQKIDYVQDRYGTGVFHGGRTLDGGLLCYNCFIEGVDPDAREVKLYPEDIEDRKKPVSIFDQHQKEIRKKRFSERTSFAGPTAERIIDQIRNKVDWNNIPIDSEVNTEQLKALLTNVNYDINRHKLNPESMPSVPVEIKDSINYEILTEAWGSQNYEWIRQAYTAAWAQWFAEETSSTINCTIEELLQSVEEHGDKENK